MQFPQALIPGRLVRRYKRFLADIELENGEIVVAHCTNSGSMASCLEEHAPVYLTPVSDPHRKTKFTWEMIFMNNGWIGINTGMPNLIAFEAIRDGKIPALTGYHSIRREVTFQDSRFDIYAENEQEKCFIEVKNVTLKVGRYARFPDAVSSRGLKHLMTLMEVKRQGMRALMLYVVQRMDVDRFAPAADIDPAYTLALKKASKSGVEIVVIQVAVSPEGIEIAGELPFEI